MLDIAKVFTNGHSQAVRLPKAYRVNVEEMWISKNEATGEITLQPKDADKRRRDLKQLFALIKADPIVEDFIPARHVEPPRNPLEEWAEPKAGRAAKRRNAPARK
jgi:antitoxin VapB